MAAKNESSFETAFTVSVEAREGVTTGISAHDRAHTIQVAIDPRAEPHDLVQPGHVFPLKARHGGVLERTGQTEAGVDLARLAGLIPAAVICEIMNDDGTMARVKDLIPYCERHALKMITVADLIAYRRRTEKLVERVAEAYLPTEYGEFNVVGYRALMDQKHHVALVKGDVRAAGTGWCRRDGARALRVPHRRRVPLHALRLRPAARGRARADRGGGPRRAALPARRRAAASACSTSCARTSCRRAASTPSTRTSSSASPPTCATTASARRSWSTSGCAGSASSRTTPRRSSGWRATASRSRTRSRSSRCPGEHNRDYLHDEARQARPHAPPPGAAARRDSCSAEEREADRRKKEVESRLVMGVVEQSDLENN